VADDELRVLYSRSVSVVVDFLLSAAAIICEPDLDCVPHCFACCLLLMAGSYLVPLADGVAPKLLNTSLSLVLYRGGW
jgi:hypothetical protein